MNKILLYSIFIVFFFGLFFVFWNFYVKEDQGESIIRKVEIAEKTEFLENLFLDNYLKLSLKKDEFLRGFWYLWIGSNGEEEVRFFDPNALARSGLSLEEIKILFLESLEFEIVKKDDIKVFVEPKDLPEELSFNNLVYSATISGYDKIKSDLENKKNKTALDYKRLSEIYGIEGLWEKKEYFENVACKMNQNFCLKGEIEIFGVATNQLGEVIPNTKIKILSKKNKEIYSDENGIFNFEVKIFELENLKFQFEKEGYTSSLYTLRIFSKKKKKYNLGNIILSNKSAQISKIDLKNKKVLSGGAKIEGENILVDTGISKYTIPLNSFWDDEEKFEDVVKIVTFEFNSQNSVPNSFLNIDTFGDGVSDGLIGNYMITFGMPYMEIFDEEGKRIFIKEDNPATLATKIENYDNMIKGVGEDKIVMMLKKSSEDGISITSKYLTDNFITHPPFWILDQRRGVWDNVPMALLDYSGNIETIYYTSKY